MNQRVIIVGGGAAGLMAAGKAAEIGANVVLLEKGSRLGRKLLLTGNGRCNLTNLSPTHEWPIHLGPHGDFMRNALARFGAQELRAFFQALGIPTIADDQGRVYPASEKSLDILDALIEYCRASRVELVLNTAVRGLTLEAGNIAGVETDRQILAADAVILATGGKSWAQTGSNGDGYYMLRQAGHTVSALYPGLVPLIAQESWIKSLEGLSFAQVAITAYREVKRIGRVEGDFLFTADGLSGPAVLNLSSQLSPLLEQGPITLTIDFQPHIHVDELASQIQSAADTDRQADVMAALQPYVPRRLAQCIVGLLEPAGGRGAHTSTCPLRINQLNSRQRSMLIDSVKRFPVTGTRTRPFREAIVTLGGVRCEEVEPVSFASRKVPGLYITGELLDIAGETGGYNLQSAFTSGWLAGLHAAGAHI